MQRILISPFEGLKKGSTLEMYSSGCNYIYIL